MKKNIPYIIIATSIIGVILNFAQVIFVLENNNKLLESLDLLKYFTIQSNILVVIYFILYVSGKFQYSVFFNKFFGTVLLSIFFTFFVFFTYLEWTYDAVGLDRPASLLNHYITPLLIFTFFYLYKDNYSYKYKDIKIWLLYPVSYLLFLIAFGLITGDYIYPFFQVSDVGVFGLIIAALSLVVFFVILSFLLVKILSKKENA